MIAKPRSHHAATISQQELLSCHHWLGRLSMCLAITSHDLPAPMRSHSRATLDEFSKSGTATKELSRIVREEVGR